MTYLGAIDVGGTKTMVGIVDSNGKILSDRIFSTFTANFEIHFAECCIRLYECLSERRIHVNHLKGLGVTMPGLVDAQTGFLLQAPFAGWYNVHVKDYFSRMLNYKSVIIENDVNACAMGELVFGHACDNYLWVTVSTGIGGALVIDRKLIYGSSSCAGEIGHVKVEYDHPAQCSCGQWGCAEAHGSGTAITRMFSEKVQESNALKELLDAKKWSADAKSCALLAKEGNQTAIEVLNTAGMYIGRALSYAANLFNPNKIYIGGGVSDSFDLLLPSIQDEFLRTTLKPCANVEIVKTALSYEAALIGAAAMASTIDD